MANEVSITTSVSASKGGVSVNSVGSTGAAAATFDMPSGSDHMATVSQAIGFAADEALDIPGDVTPLGVLLVKNLDSTNYVELSFNTGGSFAGEVFEKLIPGATYVGHPPTTTIYAQANTAACNIAITCVETIE